ncbi:MAG: hypothetical protein HY764_03265 [Candidatus Portnoybacteria bacterium]|nr:hypothetical protein [Candidatus Portnoybacteria bacterium]
MNLEELNKRLYKESSEFEDRPGSSSDFEPGLRQKTLDQSLDWQKEGQAKRSFPMPESRKKKIKIAIICLVVAAIVVSGLVFWWSRFSFDKTKVSLEVFGPERVASGEEVNYIVRYKNNTKTTLKNLKLTFIYPEGSLPVEAGQGNLGKVGERDASVVSLPDLSSGQEGQKEFRANIAGLKNDEKKAQANLEYQPANISSSFENSAEFSSVIFSVPLVLNFDLPERVVSGQEISVVLKYLNSSDISFSDVVLAVDYPQDFNFKYSLPNSDENSSVWRFSEISPGEEGKIIINGVLSGIKDEIKAFKARAGIKREDVTIPVSEGFSSALISVSPLAIETQVNGSRDYLATAGETLNYKLTYENTVDVPINSTYIVFKFDSRLLDFNTLDIEKGFFNNLDSTITWNEASLPDLETIEPGQKKTVNFSVKVKQNLPISNFNDKNFVINTSAKIDSPIVPVSLKGIQLTGQDSLATKLNSKLIISSKGYYYDSLMPNSGPLPPAVGQQTTYTIYWRVINSPNDVEDVIVETYLPPYVRWLDKHEPDNGSVQYNQTTGKLTWTLGRMPANTGVLLPVKQLVFQIGLLPGSDQIGRAPELVQEAIITGKDLFTGASLKGVASSIATDLPDDPGIDNNDGNVRQ